MNSEEYIILSFIFKRSGKTELKESEIYLPLSLELSWFTATDAKDFVRYCLQQQLLIKKGDLLSPSFDIEKIAVPVGFNPMIKDYKIEETKIEDENIVESIVQQIILKEKAISIEVYDEINQIMLEKNIVSEVAVLLVAQKYDIDISNYFDGIEKILLHKK